MAWDGCRQNASRTHFVGRSHRSCQPFCIKLRGSRNLHQGILVYLLSGTLKSRPLKRRCSFISFTINAIACPPNSIKEMYGWRRPTRWRSFSGASSGFLGSCRLHKSRTPPTGLGACLHNCVFTHLSLLFSVFLACVV